MTEQLEEEGFSDAELAAYRDTLECLLESLKLALEAANDNAQVVDLDAPIGRLTRMDALQQQQMAAANVRRQRNRLALTKDALVRVNDPDMFGFCARCDDWIGRKRMEVRPESPMCVACQSGREPS